MVFPSMMKFHLGRLVITPAVLKAAHVDDICRAIDRHVCGLWGEVSDTTNTANEAALVLGGELLSVHRLTNGTELRAVTAADRLTTTLDLLD